MERKRGLGADRGNDRAEDRKGGDHYLPGGSRMRISNVGRIHAIRKATSICPPEERTEVGSRVGPSGERARSPLSGLELSHKS